ncbi:hypothetical protein FNV43_RR04811 [Rhamnella rubrinervis]|uniref:Pre-rRNA-processing protein TSR2 homolog n=1 Tax=Rhamnella rubrinervis TaxID=2594499 RepID=A0A8K0HMS1_9ROSA|nr:hypothetical protein FNV43_RR04811 [Rhamnella rubrinervis]
MEAPKQLSAESQSIFSEGIRLVLSQWSALQMAVGNEWGGRDSRRKSELLGTDIFSWFTQSREPLYIDDLETILDEAMISLNTMTEDGSVEEVAEKLMIMHEECLDGNFSSIVKVREANHKRVALPHVRQCSNGGKVAIGLALVELSHVMDICYMLLTLLMSEGELVVNDDDDDDEDDDKEDGNLRSNDSSEMAIDGPQSLSNLSPLDKPVAERTPKAEAEDGWTVVGSRRNRDNRKK